MSQASEQIARQFHNAGVNKKNWGELGYNVLSYGLTGDGVTDDTAALQALINKVISEGGRTIFFPHGQYYVTALNNTDQVDFVGDNSTFVGGYAGVIGNMGGFATLQDDIKYMGVASQYGVDPSIGTNDATNILNNYFSALKSKGLKYAYFDKPHIYHVAGPLTEARDLILIGNATIKSSNLDNYYIQICKDYRSYDGKYNDAVKSENMFASVWAAIRNKTSVNVTIWGDSISTGGGDIVGINFNNSPSFSQFSPNGVTVADAYYYRLIDMLVTTFKDVTFNFYNRAIAGGSIYQWNESKTIDGVTKSWIDHIKDTKPDLLLIAFGMNTTEVVNNIMYSSMKQMTDYIDTNFNIKPSVTWMSAPRPVMALDSPNWGSYTPQFDRDMAAYQTRNFGKEKGQYVIDVNKVSNIKRAGRSFENPIMEELAVNDAKITEIISGQYTKSGAEYILSASGDNAILNVQLKDFIIEFQLKASSVIDNDTLWFGYNSVGTVESVMLIKPLFGGVAQVSSYGRYIDTYWTPKVVNDTIPWNDGLYRTIRIEKRDGNILFFVDGNLFLKHRADVNNMPGIIRLRKEGTSAAVFTIQNFKLYAGTYTQYLPIMTEYEMWGKFIDGDYNTKPGIGGNGANHPTNVSIEEVYGAALKEFVSDLANIKQSARVFTATFPIDSVGYKNVVVNHNLRFVPKRENIYVTVDGNGNNVQAYAPFVNTMDSINVTITIYVAVAESAGKQGKMSVQILV